MDKTKESLKIKFDDYSVYHDQDDKLDLVVAVHTKLGPNLANNNTFQGLVGLRVPQLQKRTYSLEENKKTAQPGQGKDEPHDLDQG